MLLGVIWGSPKWRWIFPPKSSSHHVSLQTAALAPHGRQRRMVADRLKSTAPAAGCAQQGWHPAGHLPVQTGRQWARDSAFPAGFLAMPVPLVWEHPGSGAAGGILGAGGLRRLLSRP